MRWFRKPHAADNLTDRSVECAETIFHVATCAQLLLLQPSLITRQDWLPPVDVSIPSISSGQMTRPAFNLGARCGIEWSKPFYSIDDGGSYEIRDAVVHQNLGLITAGPYVIRESLPVSPELDLPGFRWIDEKTVHLPSAPKERHVDFALHAVSCRDETLSYSCWLKTTLPVIGEHLLHGLAKGATILLPKIEFPNENEMLRLLPLLTNVVSLEDDSRICCDRLVFVPALFALDNAPHPRGLDMIRHLLADNGIFQRRERKIYLRRKSSGALEMSNEEEACHILHEAGFEIYDIDLKSVIDRMKIAASAHTIVSQHGECLVDMFYAPSWVKVVEFHRDAEIDWSMRRLSSIVPASYGCLIGRQKPKRILQSKKDAARNPWLLPLPELRHLLS